MDINPLTQIDWRVIVAMLVIVTLTYLGMRKFFVGPYLEVMLDRDRLLDDAADADARSTASLADAESEATRLHEQAQESAHALVAQARERAEAYRDELVAKAASDASARMERGRAEIATERARQEAELRDHAVECVGIACGRLSVRVDDRAVEAAVDQTLTRTGS